MSAAMTCTRYHCHWETRRNEGPKQRRCELKNVEDIDDRAVSNSILDFLRRWLSGQSCKQEGPRPAVVIRSLCCFWFFIMFHSGHSWHIVSLIHVHVSGKVPAPRTTVKAVARGTSKCLFSFFAVMCVMSPYKAAWNTWRGGDPFLYIIAFCQDFPLGLRFQIGANMCQSIWSHLVSLWERVLCWILCPDLFAFERC